MNQKALQTAMNGIDLAHLDGKNDVEKITIEVSGKDSVDITIETAHGEVRVRRAYENGDWDIIE